MLAVDCNCRGGEAIPVGARFGTIPPVCIAFVPKGHKVPKGLPKGCLIKFAKPKVVA